MYGIKLDSTGGVCELTRTWTQSSLCDESLWLEVPAK